MNCREAQQLIDAHLDGQLSGSLRLEFEAHRLRCARCQQTLAMMEACLHVVASDRCAPPLSDDFTSRVMSAVGRRRAVRRRPLLLAGGMLSAAAAVLLLAVGLRLVGPSAPGAADPSPDSFDLAVERVDAYEAKYAQVLMALRARLAEAIRDGQPVPADMVAMADLLNIELPAGIDGRTLETAANNPLSLLFGMVPAEPPAPAKTPDGERHSL